MFTCFSRPFPGKTLPACLSFLGLTLAGCSTQPTQATQSASPLLIQAARVFDGQTLHQDWAVLLEHGKITAVGAAAQLTHGSAQRLDLGDATLLPGLIELHSHANFRQLPADTLLSHGITSVRNLGGPAHPAHGGDGQMRDISVGAILTAPSGYPIVRLGAEHLAQAVSTEAEARAAVKQNLADGAVAIKIALEPGGEAGAPWAVAHEHGHGHAHAPHHGHMSQNTQAWPMLSLPLVKAIVDTAHAEQRRVTAHIGEAQGAKIALEAGVDEWAHMPCAALPDDLLQQAAKQGVVIVGTLDTLSHCHGVEANTRRWAALGGELLYGAEVAHPDIPWGIDAQELQLMQQWAGMSAEQVLHTATAKAGDYLGIPLLGTLQAGAPADVIAVKGNALENLKALEYPGLVISGGQVVVNQFGDD